MRFPTRIRWHLYVEIGPCLPEPRESHVSAIVLYLGPVGVFNTKQAMAKQFLWVLWLVHWSESIAESLAAFMLTEIRFSLLDIYVLYSLICSRHSYVEDLLLLCHIMVPWWRHQMETFSMLLALCGGNYLVTVGFPSQRIVTRSFDVFFDLHLNKQLSKQLRFWGPSQYKDVILLV